MTAAVFRASASGGGFNALTASRFASSTAIAAAAFVIAGALTIARHVWAPLLLDFGTALFYPARAFLDGVNPYDRVVYLAQYPASAPFPYPPGVLMLGLPFALLTYDTAGLLHILLSIAMVPLLAVLALRLGDARVGPGRVLGLAAILLLSRPGHMAVVQGQPSLLFILASYGALACLGGAADASPSTVAAPSRRRAWSAAALLAVALSKPTIGGPLALLLVARDRSAIAVRAAAIAIAISLVPAAALATRAGGIEPFARQWIANQRAWTFAVDNEPSTSIYRLDAVALTTRLLGSDVGTAAGVPIALGILLLGALGVRRLSRRGDGARAVTLMCTTTLLCVYHQTYDALMLAQAVAALTWGARGGGESRVRRAVLLALVAVPLMNHAVTYAVIDRLGLTGSAWTLLTSLNGAAVLALFALELGPALRPAMIVPLASSVADASGGPRNAAR